MTKRVIPPAEATEIAKFPNAMSAALIAMHVRSERVDPAQAFVRKEDCLAYGVRCAAASPASGKVTEAEVSAAYAAAKEACEGCTSNFCGDCDCDGFTCKEGIRAVIASLGLEVGKACTVNKRLTKPVGPPTRRIRDGGW